MSDAASSNASKTDWERLRAMRDEDIDLSDIPEATDEEMDRGVLWFDGKPVLEDMVLVPLEKDLVERFKARAEGRGYRQLISTALRAALS